MAGKPFLTSSQFTKVLEEMNGSFTSLDDIPTDPNANVSLSDISFFQMPVDELTEQELAVFNRQQPSLENLEQGTFC
jgi:hypothetical protein